MRISVIIPTYKRPGSLLKCLGSLQHQTYNDFEILVVDNDADPATRRLVTSFAEEALIAIRYLPEPELGVHYARNSAVDKASGDLLLYTDDDVSFAGNWVNAYALSFSENSQMAAAGGPVRPVWEVQPPQWLVDFIGSSKVFPILSFMEPFETFRLSAEGFFFSCNMAIRKSVLKSCGGFHPEATGKIWLGDGETGLNRKLWEKGMLIGYVPEALVYHHIPPERMTPEYFCRRMANEGNCAEYAYFHKGITGIRQLSIRQLYLFARLLSVWGSALSNIIHRDPFARLRTRMYIHHYLSRIRYVARLSRDKSLQELVLRDNWLSSPNRT
jgi:glycosyltransferase involved in cell wall biosynthesis